MVINNITKNTQIAYKASVADTFLSRMKGLLGRSVIGQEEALIITKCNSIHMFFMRFAIDAIFVDKNNVVVGLVKNIMPWQLSPIFFKASFVIELPAGKVSSTNTALGDTMGFIG